MTIQLDHEKLTSTILYLLQGCAPVRPSKTSLLKMLYYVDSEHYRKHLTPVTGAQYVALERGPVVNDYKKLLAGLVQDKALKEHQAAIQGRKETKTEYLPLREPDMDLFSESEIEVIDDVICRFGRMSGAALSERTHLEGPWTFAWNPVNPGNPMPYVLFRWLDCLPSDHDLVQAKVSLARPEVARRVRELNGDVSKAPSSKATRAIN